MIPASPPLGLFNQMWGATALSDRAVLETAIGEMALVESLGFASVWIGEHHLSPSSGAFHGRVPAAEVFLAHLAARLPRITVGTGVKLFATDARRAAEEMMMLQLLAPDRVEFGIGQGPTLPGSPESREEKSRRFRRQLSELLFFLTGEMSLSLAAQPNLAQRLWIAARDDESIALAAERGLNFVVGQAEIGIAQARFVRRYRAAGGQGEARGVRLVFLAETHAEAVAQCAEATELYFAALGNKGYHAQAVAEGLLPETADTPEERRRQVDFLVGRPDEVAERLNAHIDLLGLDRLDLMPQLPGLPTDAVQRSLRLIATELQPRLRFPGRQAA
ncbi:MAG TPA: LLM class flavin-dependent oxidoreductase [Acidisoma sp.]|uniref:LLM class flavin-dependent oxidoreductase n=1 Tax=Acidisoma sp. TaxID=1872115 RepID=UPI002C247D8A|nr:LLM class flavin-dependent oxidoreductase [Acidisoma sp.]HTH99826.1 LLM class flavin-dependent oxidoreductase [Acidisoma sp.]